VDVSASHRRIAFSLFLSVFAAQASLIALSPVLPAVAADFGVSTAAAGQLRTVAGLAAGLASLVLPAAVRRLGLRRLLVAGAALLGAGSAASAAAPTLPLLALAQLPVGVAVSALVAASTAAAGEWVPAEARGRTLAWALIGNPAAWIVGMPAIGVLGSVSWRLGWLALPLAASLAALAAVPSRSGRERPAEAAGGVRAALGDPRLRRWLLAELAANTAWLGTLVYAGALFTETYGLSPGATGGLLALAAIAFAAGNLVFRRRAGSAARRELVLLASSMAVLVALFGALRPAPAVSATLLAAASFLGGGRTLLGNAYGLAAEPERRVAAMAARAAANQFGSFIGAAIAGLALSAGGYTAFGVVLALAFGASTLPLMRLPRRRARFQARPRPAAAPARAR
jgi:DHA1 family inner membrane transport protein